MANVKIGTSPAQLTIMWAPILTPTEPPPVKVAAPPPAPAPESAPVFVPPSPSLTGFIEAGRFNGWSPRTVRSYRLELLRAEREMGRPLAEFTHETVRDYLMWVASPERRGGAAVKACTVNKAFVILRSWRNWALAEDVITIDPTRKLHQMKEPKRLPIHLSEDEVHRLLDAAHANRGALGKAMLACAYYLGARASEVVGPTGLTVASLDLAAGMARLFGKGSKERTVPVAPNLAAIVREWLEVRGDAPGHLFPLATYDTLRRVFNNARRTAGITREVGTKRPTAHTLRHSFATKLLDGGVPIEEIQQLLGHSNITTTMLYSHARVKPATVQRLGEVL